MYLGSILLMFAYRILDLLYDRDAVAFGLCNPALVAAHTGAMGSELKTLADPDPR